MRDSGGKLKLPYVAKPVIDPDTKGPLPLQTLPSDAVWSTAKESALVVLLPRQTAELYARLSWQHQLLVDSVNAYLGNTTELAAFEDRFDEAGPSSTPDLSRMTVEQLDEYSAALTRDLAFRDRMVNRLKVFDAQTRAILDGAKSEDDLMMVIKKGKYELEK